MSELFQEKIDDYHAGKMTPDEVDSFERELAKDPSLLSESNLQKEIIDGLKGYRKSQLKSRLDAIDLTPAWTSFGSQPALIKSLLGVSVATIIGTGIYFYGESDKKVTPLSDVTIDAPRPESITFDRITPAKIFDGKINSLETTSKSLETNQKAEDFATDKTISKEDKKVFVPSFEVPEITSLQDDKALQTSFSDELSGDELSKPTRDPIEVETEITKSLDVRYKYYDGKLFLSGDFDKVPYEILEINSANGRRIYIKYLNKYYKVETTDRLSILPEVVEQKVIEELRILRESK
ncbi:MAG: hypothetical protein OXH57_00955 [Ekhidna sp.]|nr:hypothetical protein [Ekhidna sp.]